MRAGFGLKLSSVTVPGGHHDLMRAFVTRLNRAIQDASSREPDTPSVGQLLLGGPPRYTWQQLVEHSGMPARRALRLWRAFGFPEPVPDEVAFTDADRGTLRRLAEAEATGLAPVELQLMAARPIGRAMSALADWQVDTLRHMIPAADESGAAPPPDTAARLLALLDDTQDFVWRRHFTTMAERLTTTSDGRTQTMFVGFADMVGFTRMTREVAPAHLMVMIENFQEIAHDLVAANRGRIVKTIGDEVLFVANRAIDAAEIALGLIDECARQALLPNLRVGLACGSVTTHYGDVFGEPVNIAARLTSHAPPGRVLLDANLAEQLAADRRYRTRVRRPIKVRGYNRLENFGLTWSQGFAPAAGPEDDA